MPPNTVKVDRATRFGNPFRDTHRYACFAHHGLPAPLVPFRSPPSLDLALDLYVAYLRGLLASDPDFLLPLKGKNLACWCALDAPCHADILLRLANPRTIAALAIASADGRPE
jgi:hypothetical protein